MSEDNSELLARISLLAGQINRHKNQTQQDPNARSSYYPPQAQRGAPSYRARGRGHPYWTQTRAPRGRGHPIAAPHRNKTLILNSTSTPGGPDAQTKAETGLSQSDPTMPGWVAKRDRHMQLINTSVYDKQMKARNEAMAKTVEEKLKRRKAKEQLKINRYLQAAGKSSNHEIVIGGDRYQVVANGSKLVRISGEAAMVYGSDGRILNSFVALTDSSNVNETPKKAVVAGVQFTRTKNGNLVRTGSVRAARYQRKLLDEPCQYFTSTGIDYLPPPTSRRFSDGPGLSDQNADRFRRAFVPPAGWKLTQELRLHVYLGKCNFGTTCRYTHDPAKVAICPQYLAKGSCPDGDSCDLSHDPTPNRVPMCIHFAKGYCTNDNCRYAHVRVNPNAPICTAFAYNGYCPDGSECAKRHVYECPEYDEKGDCTRKNCKLPHVERAGKKRAAAAAASTDQSSTSDDDDEDEDFASDVDSEYDFLGHREDQPDDDATMQLDYIQF